MWLSIYVLIHYPHTTPVDAPSSSFEVIWLFGPVPLVRQCGKGNISNNIVSEKLSDVLLFQLHFTPKKTEFLKTDKNRNFTGPFRTQVNP